MRGVGVGGVLGVVLYALAVVVVDVLAPKRLEGGVRHVVDWPWPVHAALPSVLAVAGLLTVAARIGDRRTRLALLVSAGTTMALATGVGLDLLRRSFVGKL